ncbi:MAG: sigma-54-dependent Fis family transcriptional regulator [candidate division NC10 bacterium]|nr:sigma-54-dependent Fis family transcriptional regulator [candidate division NC10 bacterium]
MDLSPYWESIIETMKEGLLVVNPEGTIIAVNPAAEALTGYSALELIGSSCRVLDCTGCIIYGDGPGEKWCKLFQEGTVKAKKCRITHKDHRSVSVIKNATVLRDPDGRIIGAVETLTDISDFVRQQEEIMALRKTLDLSDNYFGILGKSAPMQRLFEMIESVAQSDAPVIISGQSGTGKEMVARAIHWASPRQDKPFIKVSCAALNENLLETELFGHVKGAYTGADRSRVGRFEAAHGGSIFLDEIGDIPPATQVKLLRVLEEKEIERVGDHTPIPVDVRIITATNKNLEDLVARGAFREDLYFRIHVFPLTIPPLRERPEDIPIIIQHFIGQSNTTSGKKIAGLSPEAVARLTSYTWPGNVRELRNAIEYALVLCPGGEIGAHHLPHKIAPASACPPPAEPLEARERDELVRVLRQVGGNQSAAARRLRVSRVTVWKRMKKHHIDLTRDVA